MSKMVQRVEDAIAAAAAEATKDGPADPKDLQANITKLARAAIAAMREPTEAMLHVGPSSQSREAVWRRMIDKALEP